MTITEEQREEMLEAAKPLIQFLNTHGNPHVYILVDTISAQLLEGIAVVRTLEYLKD